MSPDASSETSSKVLSQPWQLTWLLGSNVMTQCCIRVIVVHSVYRAVVRFRTGVTLRIRVIFLSSFSFGQHVHETLPQ